MIRSAMLFFPRFMILLIITCTQRLLYLASGEIGRRMTFPLRGTGQSSEAYCGPSVLRVPYLLRCCLRPLTPRASSGPRMMW